jgi:DNA (cytosine-5)-methyltransferase 1
MSNTKKYSMIDLCAGTGAFSLAFENTGKVKTIFANDYEKNSKIIYDENFNTKLTLKDIHDIDVKKEIPEFDILTAGFPCQSFSIAGKQEGFNDPRSNVFYKIIEIMKIHKPRIVVLENVKNLQSHDNGKTFEKIVDNIQKLNYSIKHKILNTCDISKIPQNRERIYIVCFRDKNDMNKFMFPNNINEEDKLEIKDIIENNVKDKYYYTNKLKIWNVIENSITKNIDTNTIYQYRRYYVRENKNNLCPTLTANMGSGGHNVPLIKDNKGIRKLTPRECFNFQGFPNTYKLPKMSDSGLYKLAGNAVSYPVIQKIALNIISLLN